MANNKPLIEYLKVILGKDVSSDIVSYISSMNLIEDYEEFMENIVDKTNSSHLKSYNCIKDIIFGTSASISKIQKSTEILNNNKQNRSGTSQKKGKAKFYDINKYEVKKKETGRTMCDCLGQEHEFLNNCLQCGRIHCMEEGPGPCLFCGNMIVLKGNESYLNGRKQKTAMKPKQNKVFDDDNDYFKVNSKVKTNKDDKHKMVVALDFATRRVIESTQEDMKIRERLLQESIDHLKKADETYRTIQKQSERSYSRNVNENVNEDLVNLLIQMRHKKPIGVEDLGVEDGVMPIINYSTRVFDEDLMMNTDEGLCLSMHQPYASLLVAGVKRHEGRTWPTMHRGRLWIAAAAKEPEDEEVDALEMFYKDYYQDTIAEPDSTSDWRCLIPNLMEEVHQEGEPDQSHWWVAAPVADNGEAVGFVVVSDDNDETDIEEDAAGVVVVDDDVNDDDEEEEEEELDDDPMGESDSSEHSSNEELFWEDRHYAQKERRDFRRFFRDLC